jgi:hypothetical protein
MTGSVRNAAKRTAVVLKPFEPAMHVIAEMMFDAQRRHSGLREFRHRRAHAAGLAAPAVIADFIRNWATPAPSGIPGRESGRGGCPMCA